MTIYTILKDAAIETKATLPDVGVTSSTASEETLEMIRIAKRLGGFTIRRKFEWPCLRTLGSITLVDGQGDYTMPSDYDGLLPSTAYDNTNKLFLYGPITSDQWIELKYSPLNNTVYPRKFRLGGWASGPTISIHPVPTSADAGQIVYFEYMSKNWIKSSGGTAKSEFTADDDTICWNEEMFTMGIAAEYLALQGLNADRQLSIFNSMLQTEFAIQKGASNIVWGAEYATDPRYLNYPRNV